MAPASPCGRLVCDAWLVAVPLHLARLRPPLEGRSHANAMSCPHYDFMPLFGDGSQIFSPFLNVFCFVLLFVSSPPALPSPSVRPCRREEGGEEGPPRPRPEASAFMPSNCASRGLALMNLHVSHRLSEGERGGARPRHQLHPRVLPSRVARPSKSSLIAKNS